MQQFNREQLQSIINIFYQLKWNGTEWETGVAPLIASAQAQLAELDNPVPASDKAPSESEPAPVQEPENP
jgi:hypothetical protein